jgi:uncharacterized protein YjbI with pentapeptide repeats
VPFALAITALFFQRTNIHTEQQIALDKQREDLLQAYLDRMSDLLLKEKLRSSEVDAEVRNVARVRTITVMAQLDGRRIGHVFAFLREAGLISTTTPKDSVVDLRRANLGAVNWSHAYLSEAYLPEANLYKANLSEADLSAADLSEAYLLDADLSMAYLHYADLRGAGLTGANLTGADLTGAFLDGTNFSGANLTGAKLYLTKITPEQLAKAKTLESATMPDGSERPGPSLF